MEPGGLLTGMEILWTLLLIVCNALAGILWQKIKKLEKDLATLEHDMYQLKFNYLGRFEDIKKHFSELQLDIISKIVTLGGQIDAGFRSNMAEHEVLKVQAIENKTKIQGQNDMLIKLNTEILAKQKKDG